MGLPFISEEMNFQWHMGKYRHGWIFMSPSFSQDKIFQELSSLLQVVVHAPEPKLRLLSNETKRVSEQTRFQPLSHYTLSFSLLNAQPMMDNPWYNWEIE